MTFPVWLPFLLGLLTAVGPLATDMYLPAFDAIEADFGTAPGTAQLTLSAWFAGLCVGQMTQGTLSDRFGRRRPLIIGTLLFSLACAGCALASATRSFTLFTGSDGCTASSRPTMSVTPPGGKGTINRSGLLG